MKSAEQIINAALAIALLVALFGASYYFKQHHTKPLSFLAPPTLVAREQAIQAAKAAGSQTYDFTTTFIPGIGQASDQKLPPQLQTPQ